MDGIGDSFNSTSEDKLDSDFYSVLRELGSPLINFHNISHKISLLTSLARSI